MQFTTVHDKVKLTY